MMRSGTSLATGYISEEFRFKPIQVRSNFFIIGGNSFPMSYEVEWPWNAIFATGVSHFRFFLSVMGQTINPCSPSSQSIDGWGCWGDHGISALWYRCKLLMPLFPSRSFLGGPTMDFERDGVLFRLHLQSCFWLLLSIFVNSFFVLLVVPCAALPFSYPLPFPFFRIVDSCGWSSLRMHRRLVPGHARTAVGLRVTRNIFSKCFLSSLSAVSCRLDERCGRAMSSS